MLGGDRGISDFRPSWFDVVEMTQKRLALATTVFSTGAMLAGR